ncbi:hypothetical protein SXCC_02809 [Gluconacetobacter sp. SXCC-1]|nr:hypothetical protein SXCC_02809 [Gluconacetobacter sp. SXCC-1]
MPGIARSRALPGAFGRCRAGCFARRVRQGGAPRNRRYD